MSTVKSLYHIVINTKRREMTISEANKRYLYAYLFGIIKNYNCTLIRMNGIANHIHLLIDLSVEISLSNFMRELKRSSSIWLKSQRELFPTFDGWGKEYYAFSCGQSQVDSIVEYIKNQETHHNVATFEDEIANMASENLCECYFYD
ncbi:MAG: IS200/IS605 family transposase [Muribaculaceae bacterium]|nr:IS200/IS605 family transposase [Muribaculaceae bacterium]